MGAPEKDLDPITELALERMKSEILDGVRDIVAESDKEQDRRLKELYDEKFDRTNEHIERLQGNDREQDKRLNDVERRLDRILGEDDGEATAAVKTFNSRSIFWMAAAAIIALAALIYAGYTSNQIEALPHKNEIIGGSDGN